MKYDWKSMLNWLLGIPPISEEASQAVEEVKKEPELIVGEPVLSFVALVNSNPRRFKKRYRFLLEGDTKMVYSIVDKATQELFWYYEEYIPFRLINRTDYTIKYIGSHSFLTQDEWKYVAENITSESNRELVARGKSIKSAKANRLAQEERQRLINVYCPK